MPKRFKYWEQAYQYAQKQLKLSKPAASKWADQIMRTEPEPAPKRNIVPSSDFDPYK
jgi:hypothetical protein